LRLLAEEGRHQSHLLLLLLDKKDKKEGKKTLERWKLGLLKC
jgi:hypothetical protein